MLPLQCPTRLLYLANMSGDGGTEPDPAMSSLPPVDGLTFEPEIVDEVVEVKEEAEEEEPQGPHPFLAKSKSTPAPGQYVWHDDVNLRKRPVWSMTSPERTNLDLMIGTWTPANTSLQPRAPDPGAYSQSTVGRNGKFGAPKWSWERQSVRPCLQPDPPKKLEIAFKLPSAVGCSHPTIRRVPNWSVFGKDRSSLPYDLPTWTPKMSADWRPGPGQYNLDRVGRKWKKTTRSGCTFGGRTKNLHLEHPAWLPQTFGSRLCRGEGSRVRKMDASPTRCGCVVCPGPGRCDDSTS